MPSRRELANAIRALAMDAVQKANSGHPGMPMGMADIAEVLWNDHLRHNPANPKWFDRDRFVLSNGHGSMLQYALLHLTGYELPMAELENFRQLHSKTPGHPEYGVTPGVETTTGPLGQGLANAVGMALAEKVLAAHFNRPGHALIDHHTWVFAGDGCLMEGVSHEACSLAGTLRLGKLVVVYDDNGISIDGAVRGWFTDDTPARFASYGWHVIPDVDGHDAQAVAAALHAAREETARPSLVCCRTIIGFGSPNKEGKESAHGAALGKEEVALARERLGWTHPPFVIPEDIYAAYDARERGASAEDEWNHRFVAYEKEYPSLAAELRRRIMGELPEDFATMARACAESAQSAGKSMATRKASQAAIEALAPSLPELLGGSADLTGSNLTTWSGSRPITADTPDGNYLHYGVREFGMSAIANGIAQHGGLLPYVSTFLIFTDYARNALRMAALMGARNIFVLTHDSIGLGEDGPTHQAVEQTSSLRLIPGMSLWRPCDAVESLVAWQSAIERTGGPTCMLFSRQGLPHQPRSTEQVAAIRRGGYVLVDCDGQPDLIFIATGSEIQLAVEAAATLAARGVGARVVSMPCADLFDEQDEEWRESVLPGAVTARVAVEAGVSAWWHRYVGTRGAVLGLDRFGESAPGPVAFRYLGFTTAHLVEIANGVLAAHGCEPTQTADG